MRYPDPLRQGAVFRQRPPPPSIHDTSNGTTSGSAGSREVKPKPDNTTAPSNIPTIQAQSAISQPLMETLTNAPLLLKDQVGRSSQVLASSIGDADQADMAMSN